MMHSFTKYPQIFLSIAIGSLLYPYFRASLQLYRVADAHILAGIASVAGAGSMLILLWYGLNKASKAAIWATVVVVGVGTLFRDTTIPGGVSASLGVGIAQALVIGIFLLCLIHKFCAFIRAQRIAGTVSASTVWAAAAIWVVVVLLFMLWLSMSRYVWFWDYSAYPHLIANLADTLSNDGLGHALSLVRSTLQIEYNLVPALAPSLVEYAIGSSDRPIVIFSIALLYVGPMILFMSYLVYRASGRKLSGSMSLSLAFFSTVLFPQTFFAALYGMPDIGGVIFVIAIVSTLYRDGEREKTDSDRLATLVLCAGAIFILCAFRRWYLFIVPSLVFALAAREWFFWRSNKEGSKSWFYKAALVFGAYLTLCFLSFYWERLAVMAQGNYVEAYRAYWTGIDDVVFTAVVVVGYLPWTIFLASVVILAIDERTRMTAAGVVLCVASTLVLFMRVQALSPQHYLLVLPVMTFSVAYAIASVYVNRPRIGKTAVVVLGIFSAMSIAGVTHPTSNLKIISWSIFPHNDMRPPRRGDLPELNRLDRDLGREAKSGRTFCVVSSGENFNSSTILESAIDFGDAPRYPMAGKQVQLGDVDRRDGPALDFPLCDIAVVGDKDMTHLAPGEQQVIVYLADSINAGTGIGASFQPTGQTYDLDGQLHVRLYRRIAPIQPNDWQKYIDAVKHK